MLLRKSYLAKSMFLFISVILILACSDEPDKIAEVEETTANGQTGKTLILYNWEEYIGSETLENFEKETGIHVQEIIFKDEEEMLGAVQSNSAAYDLVVTSDDMIRELREAKLLAKLDFSKISNIKNIDSKYLNRYHDPEQKYSVPYLYGTTGMVVNKKYIKEGTDSWKVLYDERYKGKLAMLNNSWEVISVAAKLSGDSINIKSLEVLDRAMKVSSEQKPLLQGYFDAIKIQKLLIEEKLWAAEIYSGEGLVAVDENENLEYVVPKEGASIWVDHFALLRDAKNKGEAHIFLNYILRPEVNAAIASELWYATTNKAALPLMDEEVAQSPSVFPPPEILSRCEVWENVGEFTPNITRAWSELIAKK